ncbi:MAG: hypothetical protein J07HX64_00908 [halophilic archaeon J07HX64]|nr:MAG: hypothetical protein J07HX64_00908 [halophilic archaeon J07HX64]
MSAPIIVIDTAWVAYNDCSDVVSNTPLSNVFRQGV